MHPVQWQARARLGASRMAALATECAVPSELRVRHKSPLAQVVGPVCYGAARIRPGAATPNDPWSTFAGRRTRPAGDARRMGCSDDDEIR